MSFSYLKKHHTAFLITVFLNVFLCHFNSGQARAIKNQIDSNPNPLLKDKKSPPTFRIGLQIRELDFREQDKKWNDARSEFLTLRAFTKGKSDFFYKNIHITTNIHQDQGEGYIQSQISIDIYERLSTKGAVEELAGNIQLNTIPKLEDGYWYPTDITSKILTLTNQNRKIQVIIGGRQLPSKASLVQF